MSDRDALLAAIRAAPDDDAPRLIYADWLDEYGDAARAEFIRVQVELDPFERPDGDIDRWRRAVIRKNPSAPLPDDFPKELERYATLVTREQELLKAHRFSWYGPMNRAHDDYETHLNVDFRRGFVDEVGITASAFHSFGDAIREASPLLRRLVLYAPRDELPELVALPALAGIPELELAGWITEFDARFLRTFLAENVVRSLALWIGSETDEETIRTLATRSWDDDGSPPSHCNAILATDPYMAELQELNLVELHTWQLPLIYQSADYLAELFNERMNRQLARSIKPFTRRFPLFRRFLPNVWAGYFKNVAGFAITRDNGVEFFIDNDGECEFVRESHFNRRIGRSENVSTDIREKQALEWLRQHRGFEPGVVFPRGFGPMDHDTLLGVDLFGSHREVVNNPDMPIDAVELEEACAMLHDYWMKKGNFVVRYLGTDHWFGPDGTEID